MHNGAMIYPGSCYTALEDIKIGTVAHVCERLTIKKVLSDDFGKTVICSFYVAEDTLPPEPHLV
jgi:hypothetical protein